MSTLSIRRQPVLLIGLAMMLLTAAYPAAAQTQPPLNQNLDFEASTITSSSPSGFGYNSGIAKVPHWTEYDGSGDGNYSEGANLIYNNQPLDSPGVSLEGTNYFIPAIAGQYSVLLYGGSATAGGFGGSNGAAIGQSLTIPAGTESLTYWGASYNDLQITFGGNALTFSVISSATGYDVYGADISAYAGQTGELLFTAPNPNAQGVIDNIQFSTAPVPEPSTLAFGGLASVLFGRRIWLRRHRFFST